MASARRYAQDTELAQRVAEWQENIAPRLHQEVFMTWPVNRGLLLLSVTLFFLSRMNCCYTVYMTTYTVSQV